MPERMRAVRLHGYGGPDELKLEEIERPTPIDGEVLVRIHAASVNPIDWKIREGYLRDYINYTLPVTVGQDFCGTIEALGPAVSGFQAGEVVYGMMPMDRTGSYAEYGVIQASSIAKKPLSLDVIQAASVPMGALTAWQSLLDLGQLKPGQRVFIHAANGNVGGMAVQIAKAHGAHVIGAAFSHARDLLQSYGVDELIDYSTQKFEDLPQKVDLVFDTLGGEIQDRSWQMIKPGGILVTSVGFSNPEKAKELGLHAVMVGAISNRKQLEEIAKLIDDGKIKVNVASVMPLEQAAEAQELNKTRKVKGKIVLQTEKK